MIKIQLSEITVEKVRSWLKVPNSTTDIEIQFAMDMALGYILGETGRTIEELNTMPQAASAFTRVTSSIFYNREAEGEYKLNEMSARALNSLKRVSFYG